MKFSISFFEMNDYDKINKKRVLPVGSLHCWGFKSHPRRHTLCSRNWCPCV